MATSSGGCRQTLIPHGDSAFVSVHSRGSTRSSSAARLDAVARQLRTALHFLSLPLASAARNFRRCHSWREQFIASLREYARRALPLRLTLTHETANDLSRVLAIARRDAHLIQTFSRWQPVRHEAHAIEEPERASVQTFSTAGDSVPAWWALLALLQEFIETNELRLTASAL